MHWCQGCNRQLHKPKSYWLITAEPNPDESAFPHHNWCPLNAAAATTDKISIPTGIHTKIHTIATSGFFQIGTWKIDLLWFSSFFWAEMPFRQSQSVSACVHFHRGGAAGYVMLKQFPSHSRHLCKSAQHLRAAQEENSISHKKKVYT